MTFPDQELVESWRRRADVLENYANEARLDLHEELAAEIDELVLSIREDATNLELALERLSRVEP